MPDTNSYHDTISSLLYLSGVQQTRFIQYTVLFVIFVQTFLTLKSGTRFDRVQVKRM